MDNFDVEKEDIRFLYWCENFLDQGLVTLKELGRQFSRDIKNGRIKPMSKQGILARRQSVMKRLGRKIGKLPID